MTPLPGRDRRPRPDRPAPNRARTAAAVIATAAIVTACGSGSPSASSASGSGSRYQQALKYSQCMRAHGVANFPDPSSGGGQLPLRAGPGTGIDPSSNSFQAAQQACAKLLPGGAGPRGGGIPASARRQALRFSACMRSHGVPNFPDPVFSGNGARLQLSGGLSPAAPAFKAAQKACGSPLPGGVVKNTSGAVGAG